MKKKMKAALSILALMDATETDVLSLFIKNLKRSIYM